MPTLNVYTSTALPVAVPGNQNLTMPIPAGITITAASWRRVGTVTSAGDASGNKERVTTSGHSQNFPNFPVTPPSPVQVDDTLVASANQLTDIQAAIGGNLTATLGISPPNVDATESDSVTTFMLILTVNALPASAGQNDFVEIPDSEGGGASTSIVEVGGG